MYTVEKGFSFEYFEIYKFYYFENLQITSKGAAFWEN